MSDTWTEGQQNLAQLIDRIFEDGVVDADEREELKQFWVSQGLGVGQVRSVIDAFVAKVWGEVIADGVVTSDEKVRLQAVVYGLKLPVDILPEAIRNALN
jgi:hypothetical protein